MTQYSLFQQLKTVVTGVVVPHCSSLSATQAVYRAQPAPRRFFPGASVVLDFPLGNIADVGEILQHEQLLFVMYYAPWCATCMRVRAEYEKAAKYLEKEVGPGCVISDEYRSVMGERF